MQQHSNMSQSQVNNTPDKPVASNPQALQIQQLRAELWLERCLNELQRRVNDCLACAFTHQKTAPDAEAEIFQTLVQELSVALKTTNVAIAIKSASPTNGNETVNAGKESARVSETTFQICYVAAKPLTKDAKPPAITLPSGQTLCWQLKQVISLADLQHLQRQHAQIAWVLENQDFACWLIVLESPPQFPDLESLPPNLQRQLIECSLAATACALANLRQLQLLTLQSQQLETRNRELLRINQLKSEFLANTSHEIRTPLSSILGFTHLLQAQGYNPDNLRHQEYLNIILSSGQHLLALINDILDLSKIEANQLEVQKETVDIAEICRSAMGLVKEKASNKNLQLQLNIDPNATTLVADPLRIKQMLFNLLSNALKFTSKGTLGLQVKQKGIFIHFTVWDTGTGIAKEKQPLLFQPYFQIANVVAGRQEGTGLGLALTQKLAELHGGWVEFQSELNHGSQFTIVLPLTAAANETETKQEPSQPEQTVAPPQKEQAISSSSSASSPQPGTNRAAATEPIMLVEDNFHNAKLMTTYLRKLGYQVTWVNNAAQMWEALKTGLPVLILMDVNLPDVDGLTLIKQLQAQAHLCKIPVIAQTAMAMKGDRENCLAAGAVDYISKPIDLKALAALVAKYSDRDH